MSERSLSVPLLKTQDAPPPPTPPAQAPPAPRQGAATSQYDGMSYEKLRSLSEELAEQRQATAERRVNVADRYEAATGASRSGIAERLAILDQRLVQIESELAVIDARAAIAKPTTEQPPLFPINNGVPEDEVAAMGFGIFFGTVLLTVMFMRRVGRRRAHSTPQPASLQGEARLDRIEGAVDTIAVEIERIAENQRFMTRLMTETQLGASLAAVRSSTEMAKSAAAEAPVETG